MNIQTNEPHGITRRTFLKGLAAGAVGISIASVMPGNLISAAMVSADEVTHTTDSDAKKMKDGIYMDGSAVNMSGSHYTLEFIQPIKLIAVVGGIIQTEGIWRSGNKHLVSVDSDGTIIMRDGVGGYDVDISYTIGGAVHTVSFTTSQTAGAYTIEVDRPINRGAFMIRLANYFGWPHYNNVMDDGTDIDEKGNILKKERPRNFYDVTGCSDYVKPIESALDMGVISAGSTEDYFYPMSTMTREDAAVILCSAFKLDTLETDYLAAFSDVKQVSKEAYGAINTLFGMNVMRGRTNSLIAPLEGITDTEERIIIETLSRKIVSPVWAMPVSLRKFVRCRPEWFTPTEGATVHWRTRAFNISHKELVGLFIQDRGVGVTLEESWGPWYDYIPGFSTDPMFGLNNNKDLPYDNIYFCVEVEAYATKSGMQDSPMSRFIWRIDRPAWHDFAIDKLHEGGDSFPTVYRFFDNFQAAAFYIEGSKMGILYDGLMPTNTSTSLVDVVKAKYATKPFVFVLGHNHSDHKGAMASAYDMGLDVYICDRVGPMDGEWRIDVFGKDYTSANQNIVSSKSGTYSGATVHLVKEGDTIDLGNVAFEIMQLPGHCDDQMMLYSKSTGLLFSSDIYGVNRYWVADQFSARGIKLDLLLSLHQQLTDKYNKDGGTVRELYTGHNRIGVGSDYLMVWEQCIQKLVNFGQQSVSDDRRGDGAIMVIDGNSYDTLNWTAFAINGKQVISDYDGKYDQQAFNRLEIDNTGENPLVESNLYYGIEDNAQLSNVSFMDAELVGHDFNFKTGFDTENERLADGRLKYIIGNKFVPYEYSYNVKIALGQSTVTLTPVAMSDRIAALSVGGKKSVQPLSCNGFDR
jgi:glyoxylase-like metal-dependent hydrolase (beta-lactamase superfamily II)